MEIRPLRREEYREAMELRVRGFQEELDGMAENPLSVDEELRIWSRWAEGAAPGEKRLLLGAYEGGELLGFGAAAPAVEEDLADAMELLLLYVYPGQRGRGVSLELLRSLAEAFLEENAQNLLVLSHHHAPSNHFYRLLGASVLRQEVHGTAGLLMDVMVLSLEGLLAAITERMGNPGRAAQ